jgi:hypothetical protein
VARRFKPRGDALVVTLTEVEAQLLDELPRQVELMLTEDDVASSDPSVGRARDRLFPRAYLDPTEDDASAAWSLDVHPELMEGKLAALNDLRASLARAEVTRKGRRVELTPAEVQAWLTGLNDVRLVLGTILEITDDSDLEQLSTGDPELAERAALYGWLTWIQGELVETLLR